jgi:hypothetical protein
MKLFRSFALSIFLLVISTMTGGTNPLSRNQTKFKFSQAWVWQYQNDWIQPGEAGHTGDLTVYYDTLSGAWLFDAEAFGKSGYGFDFILGGLDGQYTFCFKDGKGKKKKAVRRVSEVLMSRAENATVVEEFDAYYKPTGKSKVFGKNVYGWPILTGSEYEWDSSKASEKKARYLGESKVDFQSIIYFNFLEGEVKLPFHFPTDIPLGKVLLEDSTLYSDGKKIILRLKEITDTDYHIDLSKYK